MAPRQRIGARRRQMSGSAEVARSTHAQGENGPGWLLLGITSGA